MEKDESFNIVESLTRGSLAYKENAKDESSEDKEVGGKSVNPRANI